MDYFTVHHETADLPGAERAALEDSIMQKGYPAAAGSKMLDSFISPFDATVVVKLKTAGISVVGKTKMDEFGAAGLFADAAGSESGAVAAVAGGAAEFALCNDYTGAVRRQAADRGLYYIRPTYGTVSRYGLIQAVPSMDQIGVVCKTPRDGFRVLGVISGHDPNDGAMYGVDQTPAANDDKAGAESTPDGPPRTPDSPLRIGFPYNVFNKVSENTSFIGIGFGGDIEIVEFELEYFDVFAQVMRILCCAELSNNITRYDGIKFGYRAATFSDLHDLYTKSRTEAFGQDAKLVAMLGAMVLSQDNYTRYYEKAMRIRRKIKESLDFSKYDAIVMPANCASNDVALAVNALPQLCGLPSVTAPLPAASPPGGVIAGAGGLGGAGDAGGVGSIGGISRISLIADTRREDVLISMIEAVGI